MQPKEKYTGTFLQGSIPIRKTTHPATQVHSSSKTIEAKINKYTRKLLGVPPGLSDVAMYGRKANSKLQMKSILEEYKCGKARLVTMLEESYDPVVKAVQLSIKASRKWKVAEAIDEAKESLKIIIISCRANV
ncbi:reverse transcriptase [Elysia marginata]|uniref:Reverse transcriptase n=1 Tax=Elysia marginata TaxID=1093978 RepID=A0AAV4J527_9GAST|nr:reverse transcriptase [Elysia marginata]